MSSNFLRVSKPSAFISNGSFLNNDAGVPASAPIPEALADLITPSKSFPEAAARMPCVLCSHTRISKRTILRSSLLSKTALRPSSDGCTLPTVNLYPNIATMIINTATSAQLNLQFFKTFPFLADRVHAAAVAGLALAVLLYPVCPSIRGRK